MDLHVLLIGIDAYNGGGSLKGCVNDVDAIQGVLLDQLRVPPERIRRLVSPRTGAEHDTRIPGEIPTLENIRRELNRLGGDEVTENDRVFIFYSGHGTQLTLKDDEGRRFPREALLPKDKVRGPKRIYLPDWELNAAIARICSRCHSATMILDCCSSAGATRALTPDFGTGTERFWPISETISADQLPQAESATRGVAESLLEFSNKCQVIAACQSNEKAREIEENGKTMGHLTRALCANLLAIGSAKLADLRWGRIWRQVEAEVERRNPQQHPWISEGFARPVFGGGVGVEGDIGFGIVKRGSEFEIDAGTRAGVTKQAIIGVYGPRPHLFPALDSEDDRQARVGDLSVISADAATSQAVPKSNWTLPQGARGRLVSPGENAAMGVALRTPDEGLTRALESSPFVRLADDPREATIELVEVDGGWALLDDIHGLHEDEPQFPVIPDRRLARAMVEHYFRYRAPLRLALTCRDLPRMLQMSVLDCNGANLTPQNGQTISLPEVSGSDRARYQATEGDTLCIEIVNRSDRDLYVTLIDMDPGGTVVQLGKNNLPKRSHSRFWRQSVVGQPFHISIPEGRDLSVERLVAIGTTRSGLDLGYLKTEKTFEETLNPARGMRGLGGPPNEEALEEGSILGTGTDQTSIMCYQIDGSLTLDGEPILGGVDINESDYGFAAAVYSGNS